MKTVKTLLASAVLMSTPAFAFAQSCGWSANKQQVSMSCAEGTAWDAEARACVPNVTS